MAFAQEVFRELIGRRVGGMGGRAYAGSINRKRLFPRSRFDWFATQGSSYEWNADLNGHRIDETRTTQMFMVWKSIDGGPAQSTNQVLRFPPETTPLFLDYEEFHSRPPKSGKNVVYMDGHVAPLTISGE